MNCPWCEKKAFQERSIVEAHTVIHCYLCEDCGRRFKTFESFTGLLPKQADELTANQLRLIRSGEKESGFNMRKRARYTEGYPERISEVYYSKWFKSKQAFADAIGVERKKAYAIIDGNASPDVGTLGKICKALGVSADYLLFGKE